MKQTSLILFVFLGVWENCRGLHLEFSQRALFVDVNRCVSVTLRLSENNPPLNRTFVLRISSQFNDTIARATPSLLPVNATPWSDQIEICGMGGGYTRVIAKVMSYPVSAFIPVVVSKERIFKVLSDIAGWIYFLAWSTSYYPQIFTNYSRKSVVGLNFDFVSLNIIGFFMYSLYNCGMYFSREIQHEYFVQHPKGINPVMINDVIFSLHAFFATSVITYHCFIYERGTQKVSWVAKFVISLYALILVISGTLVFLGKMSWLDFLVKCSYIKLTVTMIKYIPQAVMNYSRKSTVGWSIANVMLDFVGGIFSMLQMVINSYNYNDWDSIIGDPTKFGLGLFSAMFDVFFMYQHYVLYRHPYEEQIDETPSSSGTTAEAGPNDDCGEGKPTFSAAETPD